MKIHVIQKVCIIRYTDTLAKEPEKRKIYADLIFLRHACRIIHRLSTEYINIWYAERTLDTRYTRS